MIARGDLSFLWPVMLWLLIIVPVVAALYLRLLARRKKDTEQYASLETVGLAPGAASKWRQRLPITLYLLAITAMIVAMARPQASLMLPSRTEAVILAMDVSGSMRADDVKPSRLAAAQEAAKTFIADQPRQVRIGVVAIAGTAALVQSPTLKREDLVEAIDRFQLQRNTALGSGLVIALATLVPQAGIDLQQIISGRPPPAWAANRKAEGEAALPVAPGSNTAAAIVLLSDGVSNTGPDAIKMGQLAADHGVRIFTVGVGTPEGATVNTDGMSMRVRLDEDSLKKIALMTNGEYMRATSAGDLKKIYSYLGTRLALEKKQSVEISALFAAIGAALAALGALLSMLWFNRIL